MQGLWNLIGKSQGPGRDFTFEIGEAIQGYDGKSVWNIHSGKNKVCSPSIAQKFSCKQSARQII